MPPFIVDPSGTITAWDRFSTTGLVRELTEELGDLILCNPTSDGTTTTIIDEMLNQYIPADHNQAYIWVYGAENVVAANSGVERRGRAWNHNNNTLTLFSPGFPAAVTAEGVYEIHTRLRRERYREALNQAIMSLQLSWFRPIIDESIVTVVNNWEYELPSSVKWVNINRIELQSIIGNDNLVGYPYRDVTGYNWRVDRYVAADRSVRYVLKFMNQPPPDRILRIFGDASQTLLTRDDDLLILDDQWAEPARNYILMYAQWLCLGWEGNRQPAGQSERYLMMRDRLSQDRRELLKLKPPHTNVRVKVPGRGDATMPAFHGDTYFGAFGDPH